MRLVVGLVRGVHGLNGAVRVEVLTDRPETRFGPGHGSTARATRSPSRSLDAVDIPDGPGWRLRFRRGPRPERGGDAPRRLSRGRGGPRRGARPRRVLLARDRGPDRPRSRRRGARHRRRRLPGRRERRLRRPRRRPRASSTCRPSATSSGSSRPRRGEIVVDAEALELGPPAAAARPRDRPARARVSPGRRAGGRDPPRSGHRVAPDGAAEPDAPGPRRAEPSTAVLMALEIDIVTLFPAMLEGPLAASIPARIQERGLATIRVHDLRAWGLGRHRTVDDTPYGGGAGMVLRPEPVAAALAALRRPGQHGHPARPGGRAVPPGAGARPGRAIPPRLPLPALRGRRRADPRPWSTSSCRSATTS